MNNPFEDQEISTNKQNIEIDDYQITIWKERRGRKTNTYISGWNLEESTLKEYIKIFKRSKGCNGSLKDEEDGYTIHFQGDKVENFIEFMVSKGVDKNKIIIKGQ